MRSGGAARLSRVLGVDIGATSTRVRLVANGVVVGDATAASASLTAVGRERAAAVLDELLTGMPGLDGPLDAVCAGAAGARPPRRTQGFPPARPAPPTPPRARRPRRGRRGDLRHRVDRDRHVARV